MNAPCPASRRIAILAVPNCQVLDVTGPLDLFVSAELPSGVPAYRCTVVGLHDRVIRTAAGIDLIGQATVADGDLDDLDTLIVAGGVGARQPNPPGHLLDWIRSNAGRARRIASVCTGAFLLGFAGLLDGRRASTHWAHAAVLAAGNPHCDVVPDRIYVEDQGVWSSAGVTAGMDLALALIARDLGRPEALRIARSKVMVMHRDGGQRQFSPELALQSCVDDRLAGIQNWLFDHLRDPLTVDSLAERAGMSPRTFARRFKQSVGQTPAVFIEHARLDAARRRLERPNASVERVAEQTGFGNAERMRRSFQRILGVTPASYRRQFALETSNEA